MPPRSRASTPHRLSTRTSNIIASPGYHNPIDQDNTPIDNLKSQLMELNDSYVDLDLNLQEIQKIQNSLNGFNESFASFLYAMQINAYVVEFNEIPQDFNGFKQVVDINEKISKLEQLLDGPASKTTSTSTTTATTARVGRHDPDDTYMTNDEDGSFIIQPKSRQATSTTTTSRTSFIPTTAKKQKTTRPNVVGSVSGSIREKKDSKIPVGKKPSTIKQRPPFR